jgi:hypothetical protein
MNNPMIIDSFISVKGHPVHIGTDADLRNILADKCGSELADYVTDKLVVTTDKLETMESNYWELYDKNDELEGDIMELDDRLDSLNCKIQNILKAFEYNQVHSVVPPTVNELIEDIRNILD